MARYLTLFQNLLSCANYQKASRYDEALYHFFSSFGGGGGFRIKVGGGIAALALPRSGLGEGEIFLAMFTYPDVEEALVVEVVLGKK